MLIPQHSMSALRYTAYNCLAWAQRWGGGSGLLCLSRNCVGVCPSLTLCTLLLTHTGLWTWPVPPPHSVPRGVLLWAWPALHGWQQQQQGRSRCVCGHAAAVMCFPAVVLLFAVILPVDSASIHTAPAPYLTLHLHYGFNLLPPRDTPSSCYGHGHPKSALPVCLCRSRTHTLTTTLTRAALPLRPALPSPCLLSHPSLSLMSPQGAAGAGGSGLASLLGPERLAALLPKLYRLTHDPSPKVGDEK